MNKINSDMGKNKKKNCENEYKKTDDVSQKKNRKQCKCLGTKTAKMERTKLTTETSQDKQ